MRWATDPDVTIRLTDSTWFQWLAVIAAVGAALAALHRWVIAPLVELGRQVGDFLEDWRGRPDRPGVQGHAGAMQRLAQLENNGGSSMKDGVEALRVSMDELSLQVRGHLAEHVKKDREAKVTEREMWATIREVAAAAAGGSRDKSEGENREGAD